MDSITFCHFEPTSAPWGVAIYLPFIEFYLNRFTGLEIRTGGQVWIRIGHEFEGVLIENRCENGFHLHTSEPHSDTMMRSASEGEVCVLRAVAVVVESLRPVLFWVVPPLRVTMDSPLRQDQRRVCRDIVSLQRHVSLRLSEEHVHGWIETQRLIDYVLHSFEFRQVCRTYCAVTDSVNFRPEVSLYIGVLSETEDVCH